MIQQITFDYIVKDNLPYAEVLTIDYPASLSWNSTINGKTVKEIKINNDKFTATFDDGSTWTQGNIHGYYETNQRPEGDSRGTDDQGSQQIQTSEQQSSM